MIDGLKLTISGEELRALLQAQIRHHQQSAELWTRDQTTDDDDTPDLPEEMCSNEAERHAWRAEVLEFIHAHVEPTETYRLGLADLEFGELLPERPGWLAQHEYEERSRVGFALERLTKSLEGLAGMTYGLLQDRQMAPSDDPRETPEPIEETEDFRITRPDLGTGPEVVIVERK